MIIEKLNGERIDLKDTSIKLLSLVKSSPSPLIVTESIDSRDGLIPIETTFGPRKLRGSFLMRSVDLLDYYLQVNEVFRLFMTNEPFYLIHKREPGKRWRVQVENEFTPNKIGVDGSFEIDFISFSPYCESVGTTLDLFTFDSDLWQIGQGLVTTDVTPMYSHNTNSFSIFNAGDVAIDPRNKDLKITFIGASNGLTITNRTAGDMWQYNGPTTAGQTIELNGIRTLKQGISVFGNTNKKLITLAPGWNDFVISGASGAFLINFDFRFLYI